MKVNPFDKFRVDAERHRSINPLIFKSYDIRGIYPNELNEETAYMIGRFFVEYTGTKKIVVGRDMRLSSPALFGALIKGITDQGSDVYDLGEVVTELIYFTLGKYDYDAGIMITASHNPKEYNGFKMLKKDQKGLSAGIRGKDIFNIISKEKITTSKTKGAVKKIDTWRDYIDHVFSLINLKETKKIKVVIDAGNGMMGKLIPMVKARLPVEIIPLNFELDGNFPNHPSNPLEKGVTDQIAKKIIQEKADFGFIFDGDGDRIALIDEKGNRILADIAFLPIAKYFLEKNPRETIVSQIVVSKSVSEMVKKLGGKTVRTPVGFVNIREAMMRENGAVACEISGHYCFRDNFYSDSSLMAFLILLKFMSETDMKVSEFISEFSLFVKEEEMNFTVKDKEGIINKLKEKYNNGVQNYLDGLTVEFKDWWFNVRPSNTEPLLRLNIEADDKELLEEKKKELSALIENLK